MFNGKGNFGLWQKRVKALLVQQGVHKTLQEKSAKSAGTSDEDWEEMDLKVGSKGGKHDPTKSHRRGYVQRDG